MTIVSTTPEADAMAERSDSYWRSEREKNPTLFREELEHALELLAIAPDMGPR